MQSDYLHAFYRLVSYPCIAACQILVRDAVEPVAVDAMPPEDRKRVLAWLLDTRTPGALWRMRNLSGTLHDLPTPAALEAEGAAATFRIRDEVAVVCDLCSSLADQTPRCVYACPHEAAMRVNGRLELPVI